MLVLSESGFGVARNEGDLLLLPPILIFIVRAEYQWFLMLWSAPLLFANRDRHARRRWRGASLSGSKSTRIPQRACSVGAVSHVCDSACLVARQGVGLGLGRARVKLLVVV